jgi:hypothetical protein
MEVEASRLRLRDQHAACCLQVLALVALVLEAIP